MVGTVVMLLDGGWTKCMFLMLVDQYVGDLLMRTISEHLDPEAAFSQ